MPRGVHRLNLQSVDVEPLAVFNAPRHAIGLGLLAHDSDAAGLVAQLAEAGNVVGVHVRVDRVNEFRAELLNQLQVLRDIFDDRIDQRGFGALAAREQVGIGRAGGIEQLAKNHDTLRSGEFRQKPGHLADAFPHPRLLADFIGQFMFEHARDHFVERAVEPLARCGKLLRHLFAIRFRCNHLLDAAQLTFDALQAQRQRLLILFRNHTRNLAGTAVDTTGGIV